MISFGYDELIKFMHKSGDAPIFDVKEDAALITKLSILACAYPQLVEKMSLEGIYEGEKANIKGELM